MIEKASLPDGIRGRRAYNCFPNELLKHRYPRAKHEISGASDEEVGMIRHEDVTPNRGVVF